jgi:hypothetical protein
MYMHAYIQFTHTCIYTYTYMHACMHTDRTYRSHRSCTLHTCIHTCIHTHTNTQERTQAHHMNKSTHIDTYIHDHTCTHIHIHTVYLKTIALCALLAAHGCFIPADQLMTRGDSFPGKSNHFPGNTGAKEPYRRMQDTGAVGGNALCDAPLVTSSSSFDRPRVDLFTSVYACIGDGQDVLSDRSTFSSHVSHLSAAMHLARAHGARCLVVADEVCGGTDPQQGAALAQAILESMVGFGARVAATTHFAALRALGVQSASGFVSVALSSGRRDGNGEDRRDGNGEDRRDGNGEDRRDGNGEDRRDGNGENRRDGNGEDRRDGKVLGASEQEVVRVRASSSVRSERGNSRLGRAGVHARAYSAGNSEFVRYKAVRGVAGESEPLTAAENARMCGRVVARARELVGDQLLLA